MAVTPYTIAVEQSVLDDLQTRLDNTRWPDAPAEVGWGYGTDPKYLRELVSHWRKDYDWRKHEAELNKFQQFTADVNGVKLHFIHEKSKKANATPLLLIHGWPDSFYRYHKVIPLLTKEFDVIVPSLPGFGFSDHTALAGAATADLLAKLVTDELGYASFIAAGGDIATPILKALGANHADVVKGLHMTDVGFPTGSEDFSTMSPAEQQFAGQCQQWWYTEGGYNMLQSTKPQTIGYGLTDSPVGLAAWMVEKLHAWSQEKTISRDEMLTNIMIYWITQTINTSMRTYAENTRALYAQGPPKPAPRVEVPTAVAIFPHEMVPAPEEWIRRQVNAVRITTMPSGGHFAAWEEPELFAKDISQSVGELLS